MIDYPTRGFSIVHPTIAETQSTGWLATAQFSRLGHTYEIKLVANRAPQCLRDGKRVDWYKLNSKAQAVARKAADWLREAAKLAAA